MIAYTTDALGPHPPDVDRRSCPSTSRARTTTRRSATSTFNAAARRHRAVPVAEWKTGQFIRFVRNPNYWGTQGFADEIVIQIFKSSDTMVQALKQGDIDYARGVTADQFNELKTAAEHPDGRRRRERLERSSASTPTAPGPARPSRAAGRRRRRSRTRPSATPSATPSTSRRSSTRSSAATATSARTIVPPVLGDSGTSSRTHAPDLRHRAGQAEADAAGYLLDAQRQAARQAGQADQPPPGHARLGRRTTRRTPQFIKDWYGQLGIKVTTEVYDSDTLTDMHAAARGGGGRTRPSTTSCSGAGPATPTRTRCSRSSCATQIGSLSDSHCCNPDYDKLYDAAEPGAGRRRAQGDPRPDAEALIYDQAPYTSCTTTSNLDAYRTDTSRGWQNQPRERHAAVHATASRLHAS